MARCPSSLTGAVIAACIAAVLVLTGRVTATQFSSRTDLVVVNAVVTARDDRYVADLDQPSFTLLEDGRPQSISLFSRHDAPVTVGLLIDDSGSMFGAHDLMVAAAGAFADSSNPADEIFALAFNEHVRRVLPPTTLFAQNAAALREALTRSLKTRGRTAFHDAVAAGLDYLARGQHLRKVLVAVSDGGDNASERSFDEILLLTQSSNTAIFTIGIRDRDRRDAEPGRVRQLARLTGGLAFDPRNARGVAEVMRRIAHDIRQTYTLGYVPDRPADGAYRRIAVEARDREGRRLQVRTREGYVAVTERPFEGGSASGKRGKGSEER